MASEDPPATPDPADRSDEPSAADLSPSESTTEAEQNGRPKRSKPATILMFVLMGTSAVLSVTCCGGYFYLGRKLKNAIVEDPQEIARIREEVMTVELPEGFTPREAQVIKDFPFNLMPDSKVVVYEYEQDDKRGSVMLGRIDLPEEQTGDLSDRVQQAMERQNEENNALLLENIEEYKTETIPIAGQEVTFRFLRGTQPKTEDPYVQVIGLWPGKNGVQVFLQQLPEEIHDDGRTMAILRSIE